MADYVELDKSEPKKPFTTITFGIGALRVYTAIVFIMGLVIGWLL